MPLSPADFYAYSRATGAPVADTPEDRAKQAPEVLAFQQNRLQAPKQGPGLLDFLGGAALLAGVGAGGYGIARAMRNRSLGQAAAQVAAEEITPLAVQNVRRAAAAPVMDPWGQGNIPQPPSSRYIPSAPWEREAAVKSSTVDLSRQGPTLVDYHNAQQPLHTNQSLNALGAAEDQVTQHAVAELRRNPQVDLSGFGAFSKRADEITARNKNLQDAAHMMWAHEENLEHLGQLSQALQAVRAKPLYTTNDLLGVLPGQATVTTKAGNPRTFAKDYILSEFSESAPPANKMSLDVADRISAASNYEEGHPIQQMLLNPNISTENVRQYMPDKLIERSGRVGKNLTFEVTPGARASMTDVPTQDEYKIRRAAATQYEWGTPEHLALLDFNKPIEEVQHLVNKTGLEVHPGYEGSDLSEAYNVHTGNYDSDYMSELGGHGAGRFSDYEQNASDYGDVEGPGGLVETKAFKERTKSGTTMIPGEVSDESSRTLSATQKAQQMLNDTLRQERQVDVQIPTRSTMEGDTARGIFVDPETGELSLQGASSRGGEKYHGWLTTEDVNVEGSKLGGNYEPANVPTPGIAVGNNVRVRQDTNKYGGTTLKLVRDPGTESPVGGVVYRPGSDVLNIQPYMVPTVIKHEGQEYVVKQAQYGSLVNANLQPTTVSHSELQEVAQDASDAYFNNPTAKANYLREQNPEQFKADLDAGVKLADMGKPYDYTGFIAQHVDDYMTNVKRNPLPVLQDISAKHHFVNDLLKTSKDVPMYGKPLGGYYGDTPYPVKNSESVRLPYKHSRGLGGLDPMQALEGSEENLAYYAPRVDTVSQSKLLGEANRLKGKLQEALEKNPDLDISNFKVTVPTSSTPTGAALSVLRSSMETPQTGVGMRTVPVRDPRTGNIIGKERVSTMNIGSFARTQNPYTGVAAPVMGLASRVEEGNYQYTPEQLRVHLEPSSQRALSERNKFALTANLTPGGRVVRGALDLGGGMGVIPAGLGSLTESEVVSRYGTTGSQLQDVGNKLMAQAAYKRNVQPGPTGNPGRFVQMPKPTPPSPEQERANAAAQHMANYISSAAQRVEEPMTWQGNVKLKGVGQNRLMPYASPSEGMIQALINKARNR